jgi:opacity protein-like surface antigen
MHKIVAISAVSFSALSLLSSAAMAQDATVKHDWTGFYLGGQVGGIGLSSHWSGTNAEGGTTTDVSRPVLLPAPIGAVPIAATNSPSGLLAGVRGGYDGQFGDAVLGVQLEGDLANASSHAAIAGPNGHTDTLSTHLGGFGILGARAGWSFGAFMPYVTAGLAVADIGATFNGPASSGLDANSHASVGGAFGGGVEMLVAPKVSLFVEAKYLDFGSASSNIAGVFGGTPYTASYKTRLTGCLFQAGAAYHF